MTRDGCGPKSKTANQRYARAAPSPLSQLRRTARARRAHTPDFALSRVRPWTVVACPCRLPRCPPSVAPSNRRSHPPTTSWRRRAAGRGVSRSFPSPPSALDTRGVSKRPAAGNSVFLRRPRAPHSPIVGPCPRRSVSDVVVPDRWVWLSPVATLRTCVLCSRAITPTSRIHQNSAPRGVRSSADRPVP